MEVFPICFYETWEQMGERAAKWQYRSGRAADSPVLWGGQPSSMILCGLGWPKAAWSGSQSCGDCS